MKHIQLVLALVAVGCHAPKPPAPPPIRAVAVVTGVPGASVYLDGAGTLVADSTGTATFPAVAESLTFTYITVAATGYNDYRQDAVGLPHGNVQVWLGPGCGLPDSKQCVNLPPLVTVFVPLPRLQVGGRVFRKETGERFTAIETSDFDLYRQFLNGSDITPVLGQRANLGFNLLRVFGSFNGALGRFVPSDYGELWYTRLPQFAEALARKGLYLEFTVFADATQWSTDPQQQVAHWNRVVDAVKNSTNALLEVVNEVDQPINRLDSLPNLTMPATTNSSHGSNGSQALPVQPFWHYLTFHTNGAPEWWRKVGHNCMEIDPRPCVANENTRPDDDGQVHHFYDAAAGAALLAAGAAFHSNSGKASVLFGGLDLEAAQQWVAGAQSVPLHCQDGLYVHRQDLEGTTYLRVYQRGSDPACIVRIRF
ncbi:MAG: hypothetical protein DMF89_26440 [Acidobacteria bacterium]|nr:MAG: hypothetical protein DMF89_26440 [Acidobacteriota bacterium]